ncbi:MAG: type II secretion system GspH family protein [Bdellovibrionales bacterium]|nr:type II secretion system GspH family protein [Bdellovibrionales bacterium]
MSLTKARSGMTMIELVVAIGLLTLVLSGSSILVLQSKRVVQSVTIKRSSSLQLNSLASSILSNPKLFKVHFDSRESYACSELATARLPLAWDKNTVYNLADCDWCKGRIGYVIQPFPIPTLRGVYLATFRVYHPEETAQSSATCDSVVIPGVEQFQMIIGLKQ